MYAGGLRKISDFDLPYNNQWKSSVLSGVSLGLLTKLHTGLAILHGETIRRPIRVRQLNPTKDALPFTVNTVRVKKITGTDLQTLFKTGSLFHVDNSSQAKLASTDRYNGTCKAYFYMHPQTKDFLPLAIETSTSSSLR